MSSQVSLYSINSTLILDNEGKRIYAKYFKPPHGVLEDNSKLYNNDKNQKTFEKNLFAKTYKVGGDIILFENQVVVYKQYSDIIIYMIGGLEENESLLSTTLSGLTAALEIVLQNNIDQKSVQENYDLVALAIDETVDDGIILEYDPAVIASRVTNAPSQDIPSLKTIDLSEKGLLNAFQFARSKINEKLQQGL
ncbi:hypothetical protein PACTADRAFT_50286 [Pachysolen tannophilus NRRL Y-2460]|uniref:Coatomer subunit zeta n=1 Tax=Pachysolen tannophilus NRRL Y-2460 TaxID=669874 RepID=A0A1E4TV29_PACTA|nr:hypothetical protein PACTADRAFT_50286 [Pachysolen tannophilus NRRL Y-2460]